MANARKMVVHAPIGKIRNDKARCAEHGLAVGAGRDCVLCREARRAAQRRQRILAVVAALGVLSLSGAALWTSSRARALHPTPSASPPEVARAPSPRLPEPATPR